MFDDPVSIYIEGRKLVGYTDMSLSRSKSDLTGSLDISLFYSYMPNTPIALDAAPGNQVQVYIGNHLAFTGSIDGRRGSGVQHGSSPAKRAEKSTSSLTGTGTRNVNIGPDEYTVKVSARGKAKVLVDSSHRHPTTNMMQPTNRDAIEKLIDGFNIEIDWKASTIKLDKLRFRDGSLILDELHRLGNENAHFIYETRDGRLRVTDDTGRTFGTSLILGQNILSFSAEVTESVSRSAIKVKGQRTKKEVHGEEAVLNTFKIIKDTSTKSKSLITIQHYGDGSPEALLRRGKFEADKRNSEAKKITIEVFHVQDSLGEPWDVGTLHYVEIPPEGIFGVFECTDVAYAVDATKTLKTTLQLSPPPGASLGDGSISLLNDISTIGTQLLELTAQGNSAKLSAGITFGDWGSASLSLSTSGDSAFSFVSSILDLTASVDIVPLVLSDGEQQ